MLAPVDDDDIPAIASLINRAYRGTGVVASWCSEEAYLAGDRTTESLLRAEIAASSVAALLKWQAGPSAEPIGCIRLEPVDRDSWHLGSFAVEPDRQDGGLGREMLEAAESWVRKRGGRQIRMSVINVREALIAWYERRGYARTGETAPFDYGDDRFGTPLRADLEFVVLAKAL